MFQNLTGWHALILLAVVLLIFGAAKLPALARGVGQSVRILKSEVSRDDSADDVDTGTSSTARKNADAEPLTESFRIDDASAAR